MLLQNYTQSFQELAQVQPTRANLTNEILFHLHISISICNCMPIAHSLCQQSIAYTSSAHETWPWPPALHSSMGPIISRDYHLKQVPLKSGGVKFWCTNNLSYSYAGWNLVDSVLVEDSAARLSITDSESRLVHSKKLCICWQCEVS